MRATGIKKIIANRILVLLLCACLLCAALVTAVLAITGSNVNDPALDIYATNLSFSESIYIKYAVKHNDTVDTDDVKLLIWESPMEEYVKGTERVSLSSLGTTTVSGTECLIFDYTDISAKEMTDYVYARAYCKIGNEEYYSDVKKYSVLTYIYNKLGYTGTATDNESLASLLRGLLEYGASAQVYFDHNLDRLATDTYVKVTLEKGSFTDGTNVTLAKPGTTLTVKAPESTDEGAFVNWTDANGNVVSNAETFELTVGNSNTNLCAQYVAYEGGYIDGAGAVLASDSFALTERYIDVSNVIDKTAAEIQELFKTGLAANAVYRVSDGAIVNLSTSIDANGAAIIAPNGISINGENEITVKDLTVIGSLYVSNPNGVTLESCEVQSDSQAVVISKDCTSTTIVDCRIIADVTGIATSGFNTSVISSYVAADTAISSDADETTVYNCAILAGSVGIKILGEDSAVNNNDVKASIYGVGILADGGAVNTLITYNKISGSKNSISVASATNTVVLFNSAYDISANGATSTYIVENALGGRLVLTDNNYLLCDENTYSGTNEHSPEMSGNSNVNGNSLMDVNARNEVGAKEELLPHTNKDLFLGMEKKTTVKDIAGGTSYPIDTYIEQNAKTKSIVIVPPGAYTTPEGDIMTIDSSMNNTEIYAYGVYNEHGFLTDEEYLQNTSKNNYLVRFSNVQNVTLYGMRNGYDYQSSGQVHVLEKLGNNQILVIPAAGYDLDAGFGLSNPGVFRSGAYVFSGRALAPWGEISYTFVSKNSDGTLVLEISNSHSESGINGKIYDMILPGDVMCCRMAGDNQQTVSISNCTNLTLKDCVVNGYAAALAHVMGGTSTDVQLDRVHNCAKPAYVIDESVYNKYAALETKYNVDLEIYQDELGRYRGSKPRFGSVDATHVSASSRGLDIISCLFENSCDDGSNQRGSSSRLHSLRDNGDGTTTVYIKGMVTQVYHGIYSGKGAHTRSLNPTSFSAGDNIFIYTSGGHLVCDTTCLTSSRSVDSYFDTYKLGVITYNVYVSAVTVPTEDVNFDAIEGYNLGDHHYDLANKVIVDNISRASSGFTADNLVVRDSHARGILAKTTDATIKNCTFQNIKATGVLLNCEPEWGESTISRNITVTDCLFDFTGFSYTTYSTPKNAPVYASALNTYGQTDLDSLLVDNITIEGCEFKNYGHNYGVYLNGVKNARIIDNTFDPLDAADPGSFIELKTVLNIEISGNKYRNANGSLSTITGITAEDYVNVYGSDVEDMFKNECDIYIAGSHIAEYKIVSDDVRNKDIATLLSDKIKDICGYSISSTTIKYRNMIKLVAIDNESDSMALSSYTVECINGDLIITAPTRAALAYAVEDFAAYISNQKNNLGNSAIYFNEGYFETRSISINNMVGTNSSIFKYTGNWNNNGSAMTSLSDADYVEFNFVGTTFTVSFSGNATFMISIDGKEFETYESASEKMFMVDNGSHTVQIKCTDYRNPISFLGVKTFSSILSLPENREHYIMFIGDSMVDDSSSFAHNIANILNWDYSVVVGKTIPTSSTARKPDIVLTFFGTDEINSSSTQAQVNTFVNEYKTLVNNIYSTYGYTTQVYTLQALSTSDASAMFDTSNKRYTSINTVASSLESLYGTKYDFISADTIKSWDIEFDTAISTTVPTTNGQYNLMKGISRYLLNALGSSEYINHVFSMSIMKHYNNHPQSSLTKNMTEDGITFNRFSFADYSHAFITGSNYANILVSDTGNYLVMKYRTSGESELELELRTNDYGTDKAQDNYDFLSEAIRPLNYLATEWEVVVVDLAQFDHYTRDVTQKIQLRMSTAADILDIAYIAIVDDLAEAAKVTALELGDTQYTLCTDWTMAGRLVSLNGAPPVDNSVKDLDFVNHIFNPNVMRPYNGTVEHGLKDDATNTSYSRFSLSKTGHIFIKGDNSNGYVDYIEGKTGNYMIIKYRTSTTSATADSPYLQLQMQTEDTNPNSTGSTMSNVNKTASYLPGSWEVAVIDLAQFPNYTRDADMMVRIRFTTNCKTVDIAYAALVDNIDEAQRYISAMGETSYVMCTNWKTSGESVSLK